MSFDNSVRHNSQTPVFIVGHGSSGTSILSRLMRNYLRVSFGTESQFMVRFYRTLDWYGDLRDDRNLRHLIGDLLKERWFDRCREKWGFRVDAETIFSRVEDRSYRGVLEAIFLELARHNGMAPRWGDKTPEYANDLDVLWTLFPDGKYIHLVRDGRDVALSVMGRYWGPKPVYTAAHEWEDAVSKIDRFIETVPPAQVLELSYEELLSAPVDVFAQLIAFLEIDDSDGALLESIAQRSNEDLMQGNFDKWRSRFTPRQHGRFEQVAGDALRRHGYETLIDVPPLPPAWPAKLAWRLDNRVRKWAYRDYWHDNLYKIQLRTRETFRALRALVPG